METIMHWMVLICFMPSSVVSHSRQEAYQQETLLMPLDKRTPDNFGFGRYYVRRLPSQDQNDSDDNDETPMKKSLSGRASSSNQTGYSGRHHKTPKWHLSLPEWHSKNQEEKPPDWSIKRPISGHKSSDWLSRRPDWQNGHPGWEPPVVASETEEKINKTQSEDKTTDNRPHCFGCNAETDEKTEEPSTNNFIFHKVNVETSYDPFTKRPYHRTILAMRALPENLKRQDHSTSEVSHEPLSHYFYMFYNASADQNMQTVPPVRDPIENKDRYPYLLSSGRDNPYEEKGSSESKYRYPPPAPEQSTDYDAEEVRFRRDSMDSLWISSYLENPTKFDSISKQFRFFKTWLTRLDRHHRRKIQRSQHKLFYFRKGKFIVNRK